MHFSGCVQNKTVLITGSTDGIGAQTAETLAKDGFRVVIHGRSRERAQAVLSRIEARGGHGAIVTADLSSMEDVKRLASDVRALGALEAVIHNAGVFMKERRITADGFEMTFAVNHLAPFLLTREILPNLKAGARIITLSSIAHRNGRMDFENLNSQKSFDGYGAYATSKLCNVLFAYGLARRIKDRGISSNAVHPGVIQTKLLKTGFNMDSAGSLEEGAATSVFLASSPSVEGVTGKYFTNSREASSTAVTHDVALQDELWRASEAMLARF